MKKSIVTLFVTSLAMSSASYAVSCKDFATQADAQAYFNQHGAKKLDRDHDGIACENNRGGKAHKKSGKHTKHSKVKKHTKTTTAKNSSVTESANPFK